MIVAQKARMSAGVCRPVNSPGRGRAGPTEKKMLPEVDNVIIAIDSHRLRQERDRADSK